MGATSGVECGVFDPRDFAGVRIEIRAKKKKPAGKAGFFYNGG
jgi:hypothetical protein